MNSLRISFISTFIELLLILFVASSNATEQGFQNTFVCKFGGLYYSSDFSACWQCKRDGIWVHYKPTEIEIIEESFLNGHSDCYLGNGNRIMFNLSNNPIQFTEIRSDGGKGEVKRTGGPIIKSGGSPCWSYKGKNGTWKPYHSQINSQIEHAFSSSIQSRYSNDDRTLSVVLNTGDFSEINYYNQYRIDFYNTHQKPLEFEPVALNQINKRRIILQFIHRVGHI